MSYNKHLDNTEDELRELKEVYGRNDVNRFIDGLEAGKICTEEEIIKLTTTVRTNDGLALLEYSRLKRIKDEGFIESFATNFNHRYSTSRMLMGKLRSSISRGLTFLEDFCEKKKRRGQSKKKRKVVKSSKMGKCDYNLSLWGLKHHIGVVKELYKEIDGYMTDLTKCIELCLEMIEKVKFVRNHPEVADEIYTKSHRETVTNHRTTIRRFINMNTDLENDILKKMEEWERQKRDMKELKAQLYHKLNVEEWNDLCICEEVMAARRDGVTNIERALWGDNMRQIMRARVAYEHIDELEPEGQKGRIGGKFLYRLLVWSKILPNRGMEYWLEYFLEKYNVKGKLRPDKVGAMKMARRKLSVMPLDQDRSEQESFDLRVDELVSKYLISNEEASHTLKDAANF